MSKVSTKKIKGQASWVLATSQVNAAVTELGGHLAPVEFKLGSRWLSPYEVAPWAEEKIPAKIPALLQVLRGDFFCMPFGDNANAYRGEQNLPHGDTANKKWQLVSATDQHLHVAMRPTARKGRVDKHIRLVPGHTALYSQHVVSNMDGLMSYGHHPILQVAEGCTARVSTSPFRWGQVFPGQLENPANGGYSILQPGGKFTSLQRVPRMDGKWTDLSVYPAREGYEDIVLLAADGKENFAWTALTVAEQGYAWFALKDPRVLPSTLFWLSNGGRHYAPWNGRHRRAIGLEEVMSNFHYGLAESAKANPLNKAGIPTCVKLNPQQPLVVNYIMAMAKIPQGFDRVKSIKAVDKKSVKLIADSGKSVVVKVDWPFLQAAPLA